MSDDSSEWENAMIERRIAEMSDDDFRSLVSRTRPPEVPGVDRGAIAAAESEGRWRDAAALKAAWLWQQTEEENQKRNEG